jgi:hypothetical protein
MPDQKPKFGTDVEVPFSDATWRVEKHLSGGVIVKGADPEPWKGAHYRVMDAPMRDKEVRVLTAKAIRRWLNGQGLQRMAAVSRAITDVDLYLLNGTWVRGEVSGFKPDPNGVRDFLIDPLLRSHQPLAYDA